MMTGACTSPPESFRSPHPTVRAQPNESARPLATHPGLLSKSTASEEAASYRSRAKALSVGTPKLAVSTEKCPSPLPQSAGPSERSRRSSGAGSPLAANGRSSVLKSGQEVAIAVQGILADSPGCGSGFPTLDLGSLCRISEHSIKIQRAITSFASTSVPASGLSVKLVVMCTPSGIRHHGRDGPHVSLGGLAVGRWTHYGTPCP